MTASKMLVLVIAVATLSNCASVTRGTMDKLDVRSNPQQADVKISRTDKAFTKKELASNPNDGDVITGKTPASFKLQRKGEYMVRISKSGYKACEIPITNSISGMGGVAMAGNALVGGLIGVGVDVVSGATKDLAPNPVDVSLQKR